MNNNWRTVPLFEIADINPRLGKTTLADVELFSFVPMASVGAADGSIDVSAKRPYAEVKKGFTPFQSDDVLFAKITPCMENGKMAVVPHLENQYGFGSTEFHVIRPKDSNDPKYVYYYVSGQGFRKEAAHHMTGAVGQKRVPTDFIKQSLIPLPPTIEDQKRIVAEIEKQFSRLDEAVASLKRIQANLKRYKAAVLKAAVEGKLTEQWRKNHPDVEPADQLLKRILAERRAKWEESVGAKQGVSASPGFCDVGNNVGDCNKGEADKSFASPLPQMKTKGIKPKDDSWKKKYKDTAGPDTSNLPELPEGWVWTSMDSIIVWGPQNGIYLPKSLYKPGIPILRIDDYQDGFSRSKDELRQVEASDKDKDTYSLEEADLVINRVNSLTHLGKCLVVKERNIPSIFESNMMRLRVASLIEVAFVEIYLRSKFGRTFLTGNAKWAVNQASINQDDVKNTPVPLPPLHEQCFILEEIDRRLSVTEELETTIETNLKRAERLRQTILQQAFSGGWCDEVQFSFGSVGRAGGC